MGTQPVDRRLASRDRHADREPARGDNARGSEGRSGGAGGGEARGGGGRGSEGQSSGARGREGWGNKGQSGLGRWLRENGLTLTLLVFFAASLVAQALTGHRVLNAELAEHGRQGLSLGAYLRSGHFIEAVFENWESEFLQMAAFVLFTVWLRQKGSPESKPLDEKEGEEKEGEEKEGGGGEKDEERSPEAPWPVRRGGLIKAVYSHSLSVALGLLFVGSFALHAAGGMHAHNQAQLLHGEPPIGFFEYVVTSQFWFESFQNWQSEFFSVAVLVVLTIFLRERGSAQSKEVTAPHHETGS
jgi:uncharacterized protein DUF6766